jgi:hypothetical protein
MKPHHRRSQEAVQHYTNHAPADVLIPSMVDHHAPTTISAGAAQAKLSLGGKQQAAMTNPAATRKGSHDQT